MPSGASAGRRRPVGFLVETVELDLDGKTFTLGYDQPDLCKRTDIYAMYMNDKITIPTGNSFGVGIRHQLYDEAGPVGHCTARGAMRRVLADTPMKSGPDAYGQSASGC